jgi:hypothetical protein
MITLLPSSAALNIANTAPVVHVRQNPARKPIETAQPRSRVALIEASSFFQRPPLQHTNYYQKKGEKGYWITPASLPLCQSSRRISGILLIICALIAWIGGGIISHMEPFERTFIFQVLGGSIALISGGHGLYLISTSSDCRSEDVRASPVVITEFELGNIERHVFAAHFVERADHAALGNRPEKCKVIDE